MIHEPRASILTLLEVCLQVKSPEQKLTGQKANNLQRFIVHYQILHKKGVPVDLHPNSVFFPIPLPTGWRVAL